MGYRVKILAETTKMIKCKIVGIDKLFWIPNEHVNLDIELTKEGEEIMLKQYEELYNEVPEIKS